MGPQNVIMGDSGFDMPSTQISDKQLKEEKDLARFSQTKEFKKLKDYCEARMEYYKQYLPDGRVITAAPTGENWVIANTIISEFQGMLSIYEQAKEIVKEAKKNG